MLRGMLVGVCLLVAAGPTAADDPDPEYKGVRLSVWLKRLTSIDDKLRAGAMTAVQSVGLDAAPTVPAVAAMLRHPDAAIRTSGAYILSCIGIKAAAAVPSLVEALEDEERQTREWAELALLGIGPMALPELTRALGMSETSEAASRVLGRMGPAGVPILVGATTHPDSGVRMKALDALGAAGDVAAVAASAQLADPDYSVRAAACRCLEQLGPAGRAGVPGLTRLLADPSAGMRSTAVHALGVIGPSAEGAVPAVALLLNGPTALVRLDAAIALGRLQSPAVNAVAQLATALDDPDPAVRRSAALSIGQSERPGGAALPRLRQLASARHPGEWVAVAVAIAAIDPTDPLGLPALTTRLNDPNPDFRRMSVLGFGQLGKRAKAHSAAVAALLNDPNPDIALDVCSTLAAFGDVTIPDLIRALDHRDPEVVRTAVESLAKVGGGSEAAGDAIRGKLAGSTPRTDEKLRLTAALARIAPQDPGGVPGLAAFLRPLSESRHRVVAARYLGSVGPAAKAAIPDLETALKDRCYNVRVAAAAALGKIDPDAPLVTPSDQP